MDPLDKAIKRSREALASRERSSERSRRENAAKELQHAQAERRRAEEKNRAVQIQREREKYEVDLRVWRLNKAIRVSGINNIFESYSREFLRTTKHRVLQNLDPNGYSGSVSLMWGKYSIRGGGVSSNRVANYSVVTASFNVYDDLDLKKSNETRDFVTVGNEVIPIVPQGGWDNSTNDTPLRKDLRERLVDAVGNAFDHPRHEEWRPERQTYTKSTGGDSTPECCCT